MIGSPDASRVLLVLGLAALAALLRAPAAEADRGGEPISGLSVEAMHVLAGPAADAGQVRFRLDNHGTRTLTLTGVRSPVALGAALLMRHPAIGGIEIETVVVPRHETLAFDTSHLRAELRGLTRPLMTGETIPLYLDFLSGPVEIDAHVHSGEAAEESGAADRLSPVRDNRLSASRVKMTDRE